jgi:hypothetical protein
MTWQELKAFVDAAIAQHGLTDAQVTIDWIDISAGTLAQGVDVIVDPKHRELVIQ